MEEELENNGFCIRSLAGLTKGGEGQVETDRSSLMRDGRKETAHNVARAMTTQDRVTGIAGPPSWTPERALGLYEAEA